MENIQQALIDSYNQKINEYERTMSEVPEHHFSLRFRVRMIRMIRGINCNNIQADSVRSDQIASSGSRCIGSKSLRRAMMVCVLVAVLVISSIAAIAAVYPQYHMIMKERVKEWTIHFVIEEGGTDVTFVPNKIVVPAEYNLIEEAIQSDSYTAIYESDDGKYSIIYDQTEISDSLNMGLDFEVDHRKRIELNGKEILLTRKDDVTTLFWTDRGCVYILTGNCSEELLKQIAFTH